MPKKFKGDNSKAVEARAKKEAIKQADQEKKEKLKEDALWQDDDKQLAKKQQRKDERDKKKNEQLEKKQQLKQLYDEEMSQIKVKQPVVSSKVTRLEIEANRERLAAAAAAAGPAKADTSHDELPLEENLNKAVLDGDEARSVTEAISLLSTSQPDVEKHPEKRVKAAYSKFEEVNLPRLKQENPNMRLSQLKQILKKDWMKSPENPLNQRNLAYNSKS